MYIYILLLICSLTAAIDNKDLWNLLEDIISITHDTYVPPDANLNITELAQKYGYPMEEHTVTTQDGYIINIHRIPNHHKGKKKKPVVFLMHGILESSDTWVLLGPHKALGYVFSDHGYDVWMGNARGNKHAHTHTTLNYTMENYWQFSWEEIALYDLPAMIDYILKQTGQDSIYYVGHSQGTTVGYVLCSMKPEYNKKIKVMFSLAPEAWMGNVKSPIVRIFSPSYDALGYILSDLNIYSVGLDFFNKISAFICSIMPGKCDNILFSLSGYETKIDKSFLSVILGHTPTGSSTMQFVHYGQLVLSKRFCRFDFGKEENIIKYGEPTPPDYDLSKVTVPVVLYYSSKDWLSDPLDIEILHHHLPNVKDLIFLTDFTHIDYVYALEAVDVIYNDLVKRITVFEEKGTNHKSKAKQHVL